MAYRNSITPDDEFSAFNEVFQNLQGQHNAAAGLEEVLHTLLLVHWSAIQTPFMGLVASYKCSSVEEQFPLPTHHLKVRVGFRYGETLENGLHPKF